jgi:Mg2+ and Co2+ transporter CorA
VYRRDYIIRLIEELGRQLIALRNQILRREQDRDAVRQEIGEIARRTGIDLDVARMVDSSTLRLLMSVAGNVDPGRCWLTAELLQLEGLDAAVRGESASARRDFARALELYALVERDWQPLEEVPAVQERVAELERLLAELPGN